MGLANDYFLLYHGKHIEQTTTFGTIDNKSQDDFFDISALILCVTRKDYEKYISLKSFNDLVAKVTNKEVKNLDDIYQLQHCILDSLKVDTKNIHLEKLHSAFEYLKDENIIENSAFKILISLFDPEELTAINTLETKEENNKQNISFQEAKTNLEKTIKELKEIFKTNDFIEELEETNNYLGNQKFSIGITGVMNAGKSTMLNALMGQEILGSAVVPETANLTIVKHGKPEANVFYWNKEEWNRIESSASEIESIAEFVKETKAIFKDDLDNLIKEESVSEKVDINNLAAFTSAEASGKNVIL